MPSTRKPRTAQKKTTPATRIHPDQRASAEETVQNRGLSGCRQGMLAVVDT